jgi:hypothetical protein
MKIAQMLELETISLVEPTFSDLIYQEMDDFMTGSPGKDGKILVNEDENPVLFAKTDSGGAWNGCVTMFREPSLALIDLFEQFEWEMYQEENETILDALREYYSTLLCDSVLPGPDDLNPARVQSIKTLLRNTVGIDQHGLCLDCCCGTGVGSMVMESCGMHPIAYDNDESLLVRGMKAGRLKPERTMWIDGRMINRFIQKQASLICGFMIGEIHSFNAHIWQEIIGAACMASDRVLFTAGTEHEINQIKDWVFGTGKKAEIFESDADPIYDRWICYSE